jgi:hypothetical protein
MTNGEVDPYELSKKYFQDVDTLFGTFLVDRDTKQTIYGDKDPRVQVLTLGVLLLDISNTLKEIKKALAPTITLASLQPAIKEQNVDKPKEAPKKKATVANLRDVSEVLKADTKFISFEHPEEEVEPLDVVRDVFKDIDTLPIKNVLEYLVRRSLETTEEDLIGKGIIKKVRRYECSLTDSFKTKYGIK